MKQAEDKMDEHICNAYTLTKRFFEPNWRSIIKTGISSALSASYFCKPRVAAITTVLAVVGSHVSDCAEVAELIYKELLQAEAHGRIADDRQQQLIKSYESNPPTTLCLYNGADLWYHNYLYFQSIYANREWSDIPLSQWEEEHLPEILELYSQETSDFLYDHDLEEIYYDCSHV